MLKRMTLAAAFAIATPFTIATPAGAACLNDGTGAGCDIFLEEYRATDVPVGTTLVWPQGEFLVEDFDWAGDRLGPDAGFGSMDEVLYWDGEKAFVVPDDSGPPIEIADW